MKIISILSFKLVSLMEQLIVKAYQMAHGTLTVLEIQLVEQM
jgi:hypothetical protein